MIKVTGVWEQGWNAPMQELDLWRFPLREYEVDEFIMTPVSGIDSGKVTEYKDIPEVLKNNKDLTPVYVDENAETWLEDFEHPENALYIVGRTSFSPYLVNQDKNALSIKIRTKRNKGGLWAHQAITLVLHDRMMKDGNSSSR